MDAETVCQKIKDGTMSLQEFEEYLNELHKESFDEGYQEGVDDDN